MMKSTAALGLLIAVTGLASLATPAAARDTVYHLKIADVKSDPRYPGSVPGNVAFYFGDQKPAATGHVLEEAYVTNPKTNNVNKPDEDSCRWVMMSALKDLSEQAMKEGGKGKHAFGEALWWGKEMYGIDNALVGEWPVVVMENGKAVIKEYRSIPDWWGKNAQLMVKHYEDMGQMYYQRG